MSGFRSYCIRWADNNTYLNNNLGVKQCLEDLCNKFLTDTTYHGWSLDTSIHSENEEAILLTPSYSVYAMFFINRSGGKMMIALNYNGLSSYNETAARSTTTVDPIFTNVHSVSSTNSNTISNPTTMIGGLMGSYIPFDESDSDAGFNPSVNMNNAGFMPTRATAVACTAPSKTHSGRYSSSATYGHQCYTYSSSLLRQGTSSSFLSSSGYSLTPSPIFGVLESYKRCYCIMADQDDNIILCSQGAFVGTVNPAIRWCMFGKFKSEEDKSVNLGYSLNQNYKNLALSKVGTSDYLYAASAGYSFGSVATSDSYTYHTNNAWLSTYCRDDANNIAVTQPFPIGVYRGKTVDGIYYRALSPIAICGGYTTVKAWLNYESIRSSLYSSEIPCGAYFNNKQWLVLGYVPSMIGYASVSDTAPTTTGSSLDFLVVKLDEGNTDSPFGPLEQTA